MTMEVWKKTMAKTNSHGPSCRPNWTQKEIIVQDILRFPSFRSCKIEELYNKEKMEMDV